MILSRNSPKRYRRVSSPLVIGFSARNSNVALSLLCQWQRLYRKRRKAPAKGLRVTHNKKGGGKERRKGGRIGKCGRRSKVGSRASTSKGTPTRRWAYEADRRLEWIARSAPLLDHAAVSHAGLSEPHYAR